MCYLRWLNFSVVDKIRLWLQPEENCSYVEAICNGISISALGHLPISMYPN